MRLPPPSTFSAVARVALLLLGMGLWVVCILLLLEITRQALDVLRFIVELGSMQ